MSDIGGSLVRDYSKTVFQFQEHLGVVVIDRERAVNGMEEVVAQGGVELVVQGVVSTEAVISMKARKYGVFISLCRCSEGKEKQVDD